jgi:hypothetical protein
MGQFRRFLNDTSLWEIHHNGKLFDRAFIYKEWDEFYPNHDLCSLASMCSDHSPLVPRTCNLFKHHKKFHFRAYWPKFSGFLNVVQHAWHCSLRDADPCRRLNWLL